MSPSLCYIVRHKENLLHLTQSEKLGFHPMCLYSKYSDFSELNNGLKPYWTKYQYHLCPHIYQRWPVP